MSGVKVDPHIQERFHDCIHCGFCLSQCPTYDIFGDENDSPRGRIYLMKSMADGRLATSQTVAEHLKRCLDCRACETACPSGVRYGSLIESLRPQVVEQTETGETFAAKVLKWMIFQVFPDPGRLGGMLKVAQFAETIGLRRFVAESGLLKVLPREFAMLNDMLPPVQERDGPLPEHLAPANGDIRARVGFFAGCVGECVFGQVNRASIRVLVRNGCEVFCPSSQNCCGAIDHHGGRDEEARRRARKNIRAFLSIDPPLDAIVTSIAGCGMMLKEYGELFSDDDVWHERAEVFSGKMRDITEFLVDLPLIKPAGRLDVRLTYHDPCHLAHGQQIRSQPREILRAIDGVELVEMADSDRCCGAAGTYSLLQPELSAQLANRKLANIERTGVQTVATCNTGCAMQILQHAKRLGQSYAVVHPVELLDQAYRVG